MSQCEYCRVVNQRDFGNCDYCGAPVRPLYRPTVPQNYYSLLGSAVYWKTDGDIGGLERVDDGEEQD